MTFPSPRFPLCILSPPFFPYPLFLREMPGRSPFLGSFPFPGWFLSPGITLLFIFLVIRPLPNESPPLPPPPFLSSSGATIAFLFSPSYFSVTLSDMTESSYWTPTENVSPLAPPQFIIVRGHNLIRPTPLLNPL